jgi:hypothetical protein
MWRAISFHDCRQIKIKGRLMKTKTIALVFMGGTLFACPQALAKISFVGGNGTSQQQAVRIEGAKGEIDGVDAEYVWLKKRRPGCTLAGQSLQQGKRV